MMTGLKIEFDAERVRFNITGAEKEDYFTLEFVKHILRQEVMNGNISFIGIKEWFTELEKEWIYFKDGN